MKLLILCLLISSNVFGQASNPNDTLKIGKKSSSADKGIVFETNDGVLNKTLKVNPTSKNLIYSGNDIQIGDGATGNDKELILDPATGSGFKWDGTKQKMVFNNAGNEKVIGSGSGSGGGSNYNNGFTADQNANAEDGLALWTASAGTFALDVADPLEGEQSFTWIPSAQNDTLDSPVLDFDKDIMKGNGCQAQISYIGGDENLTLQVIDANNLVLGSEVLKVHNVATYESVFFNCPSQADITGDANKGLLRFRILNEGASASPIIKFDKNYAGTLIGLSETILPDAFGGNFLNTGVPINTYGGTNITCSYPTTGNIDCSVNGLTVKPACSIVSEDAAIIGTYNEPNTTTSVLSFQMYNTGASPVQKAFTITCHKQGADAKQSVQVYRAIPKLVENENECYGKVDGATVTRQNIQNCLTSATAGAGYVDVNYSSMGLSFVPKIEVTIEPNATDPLTCVIYDTSPATTTQARIRCFNTTTNANTASPFHVEISKVEDDFKTGTTQNISLAGIAVNSYAESSQKQVRVETCLVSNNGTRTALSDLCDTWISSLGNGGTGVTTVTFISGIFSEVPVCTATASSNSTSNAVTAVHAIGSVQAHTTNSAGTLLDSGYSITCQGVK